jgi:peptide chain release factor subunit 3
MQNMGQNPYAYNNMYNPYGGMYNQNMGNMGYNPMGYNMGYDPNMMGYNNMNDPNMMNQNMANPNNQYYNMMVNDNTMNNITNSNTNNTNQPKSSGGIVGIGGKGKKPTTSTNTTSITNSTQNKNINPNPNVSQATTKPKDTKKETNAPNTITAKPTTAASTKKPAIQTTTVKPKIEEIKETSTIEITKQINEIQLDSKLESVLETDSKEGTMIEVDLTRKPVTIVFIGHVDAGKSTISGSILYKTGQIDERTIDKYRREAKVNNRESWFMAYIMDINEEEKQRGKTVEVGKAFFSTPNKRFTILDAPGHASFVPNMLQGACQADYAGLVISAKTGEFEAGFERDGRTREHSLLAKSLGVHRLIVIVNKMDEESVKWSKDRFDKIKSDLSAYLKSCGYNIEKHVVWIPISGLTGENLMEPVSKHKCAWYEGPTLIEILDKLDLPHRNESSSVRVPILDRYKDQGIFILGKVESGIVKYGGSYTLMPSRIPFEVAWLFDSEERGVPYARPGESIRVNLLLNF